MDNYRLKILLETSGFSNEVKYNVMIIFNSLTSDKKVEIIDRWEKFFFPRILKLQKLSEEEIKQAVIESLKQINNVIDEALLREKTEKAKIEKQIQLEETDNIQTEKILQQKRVLEQFEKIKNLWKI